MHLRFLAAAISNIYMALRVRVKGMGVQEVFSSVLPVREISLRKDRGILWVNGWLHGWNWQEGCGFYNHETLLRTKDC